MQDTTLLILTALGLSLNVLSIPYLKRPRTRRIIKRWTFISLLVSLCMMMLLVIAQGASTLLILVFYPTIFLWNLGFFELFVLLLVRPKNTES